MIRVLLDTDIILDIYLQRLAYLQDAIKLWLAHENGEISAFVSAINPVNLFYIGRKQAGKEKAIIAVKELLNTFSIAPVTHLALQQALELDFKDYEDAVQHACATFMALDAIITRNIDDYLGATLPVYLPSDFVTQFVR